MSTTKLGGLDFCRFPPHANYAIIPAMSKTLLPALFLSLALLVGCAHEQYVTDANHPEIAVSETGIVTYRNEPIDPEDLPDLLKDSGLTSTDTIHIHIVSGLKDYREPYHVLGILVKNGFTRSVFVEDRQALSEVHPVERRRARPASAPASAPRPAGRRPIRYR